MSQKKRILFFYIIAIVLLSIAVSCGKKPEKYSFMLGYSFPHERSVHWNIEKETIEETIPNLDMGAIIKIANNKESQEEQIQKMITKGIDILILACQEDDEQAVELAKLAAFAGIPVIAYNTMISGADNIKYFVGFDDSGAGDLISEFLTALVPEGNFVVLADDKENLHAESVYNTSMPRMEAREKGGFIQIINGSDFSSRTIEGGSSSEAQKVVTQLIRSGQAIDAIHAQSDSLAIGAVEALNMAGRETIPITSTEGGIEALRRVNDGDIQATVFRDSHRLVLRSLDVANALLKDQTVPTNAVVSSLFGEIPANLVEVNLVTESNIQSLLEAGYLSSEDIQ